jgi:N-methylhydantoinase B
LKITERGVTRSDVWELIFDNVRLREIVEADARAQIGACALGERQLLRLLDRQSSDEFREDTRRLFDAGEQMMRSEITAIPDGTYVGESVVYDDSPEGVTESLIHVSVTVDGDNIVLDYTGTSPQQQNFMNAPYVSAASAALVSLLYLVNPQMPHNAGILRPVRIEIPEGTLLNARFPAATFAGNKLCEHNCDAVMKAMARALPERVTASWARRVSFRMTGRDPRDGREHHDVLFMTYSGGGATSGADGYNQPGLMGGGNVLHQDYELFELQNPVILLEHEYWADSAGAGKWRGGMGNQTTIRYAGEDTLVVTHGDGTVRGARGAFGGGNGKSHQETLEYPDGRCQILHARDQAGPLPPGTVSHHQMGGGAGFGSPLRRPLGLVLEDVQNGLVSVESAARDYGVDIDVSTWTAFPGSARRDELG